MVAPSLLTQELVTHPQEPPRDRPVRHRRRVSGLIRRHRTAPDAPAGAEVSFTIRRASEADAVALRDLAALDSRRPLRGPTLVAALDGRLVAALDLSTQRAIADPFHPSADAVELLRLRAAQLVSAEAFAVGRGRAPARAAAPGPIHGAPHH